MPTNNIFFIRLLLRHPRLVRMSLIINTQMKYDEIRNETPQVRLKMLLGFLTSKNKRPSAGKGAALWLN
jgi:hypothetical protein